MIMEKENGNYCSIIGYTGDILGIYRDNGKENGNYYYVLFGVVRPTEDFWRRQERIKWNRVAVWPVSWFLAAACTKAGRPFLLYLFKP